MTREKFLFRDSARLYQQSEQLSTFLLSTSTQDPEPFHEVATILAKAGFARMTDEEARRGAVDLAWHHFLAIASAMDPRSVLPGLLEAMEQFYYGGGPAKNQTPWLGTALKLAVAAVWGNLASASANIRAHAQVRRLVAVAGACEQLIVFGDQASALRFGPTMFHGSGTSLDREEDIEILNKWNEQNQKRGESNRTLPDCKKIIWGQLPLFMQAVSEVARGIPAAKIPLFAGTVFSAIDSNPDFWLGLAARVQLLGHAAAFRARGRGDAHTGISIFEPFAFKTSYLGENQGSATAATQAMFWQKDWHARRLREKGFVSNMLVERPALRIDDRTFVVGLTNIGDSINCFVEHSVFRHIGYGGVRVPEEAFRRHVSQPFEDKTLTCFGAEHWQVDHVSDNGAWCGLSLNHVSGVSMPGEVDVLAKHRSYPVAVLAECKVLTSTFNASKLINVVQKLGPVDGEGFHTKLARKAQWIRETAEFRDVEILPVLVVDEGAFLGRDAPHPVVNLELMSLFVTDIETSARQGQASGDC